MKVKLPNLCILALALAVSPFIHAANPVIVTPDNFTRAESDSYFADAIKNAGGLGKWHHYRTPMPIDHQTVIRANRDTLYSSLVADLDAGPVTVTFPDAGKRFMSLIVISEDHYVPKVEYGAGTYTVTRDEVGTRYVMLGIRTLVNPEDPKDVEEVHKLQDAVKFEQKATGTFEIPNWDKASQKKVHDALLALGATMPDMKSAFGTKEQVDPVRHLIGTASAWGGNPDKEAMYFNITPPKNDGKTAYKLTVKDVPVDGFWSISVYNAKGYYTPNKLRAYSLNNLVGKPNADGSFTIQFGGDPKGATNYLPIEPGWNYLVRLYRPRKEALDGTWKFPEAEPLK